MCRNLRAKAGPEASSQGQKGQKVYSDGWPIGLGQLLFA